MLLQDEMFNILPNEIENYLQIDDFFKSCKQMKDGSTDSKHLRYEGLKRRHFSYVEDSARSCVFTIIEDAYRKFQKYCSLALAEPGDWVVHLLQPVCKSGLLVANFDHGFQKQILGVTKRCVNDYLAHFHGQAYLNKNQRVQKSSTAKTLGTRRRGYKILEKLRRRQNQDILFEVVNSKNEWELYLEEPIQQDIGYLDYWLANQDTYPTLFHLAPSFYHTKLAFTSLTIFFVFISVFFFMVHLRSDDLKWKLTRIQRNV